eukprot:s55_g27.t1
MVWPGSEATPQSKPEETLPATDSQIADSIRGTPKSDKDKSDKGEGGSHAPVSPTSSLPSSASKATDEVTLRIVDMYQRGELDASVAMQLLGSGVGSLVSEPKGPEPAGGKLKRSRDDGDKSEPDEEAEGESLDELLTQAKKAKMETLLQAVATLNADLNTLDTEYNTLSNHVAEGERDNFDQPRLNGIA